MQQTDPTVAGQHLATVAMQDINPIHIPEDAAERLRFYASRRSAQESRSVSDRLRASVGALWGRGSAR